MSDLIEDYLREVEARLQVDAARKHQIAGELRSHLWEKVYAMEAEAPDRTREEVVRAVLSDFGSPQDLALAYGPGGGTVITKPSGEVVLRVGRAVGRGTRRFFKGLAIAMGILLVLAVAGGVWAFYEVRPLVAANVPYEVVDHYESCADACSVTHSTRSFFVHADAREIRVHTNHHRGENFTGYAWLELTDPSGRVVLTQNVTSTSPRWSHSAQSLESQWGEWTLSWRYEGFVGTIDLDVDAIGLPTDRLWWD